MVIQLYQFLSRIPAITCTNIIVQYGLHHAMAHVLLCINTVKIRKYQNLVYNHVKHVSNVAEVAVAWLILIAIQVHM